MVAKHAARAGVRTTAGTGGLTEKSTWLARLPRRRSGQCRRLQFPTSTALKKSVGVGVVQNPPCVTESQPASELPPVHVPQRRISRTGAQSPF